MKTLFEMSQQQFDELLQASQPTPLMYLSGGMPMQPTPQENAEAVWRRLGDELGFEWWTAEPAHGKPAQFFMAIAKAAKVS